MEQKRSRLVAPDATGLRARILSNGGLWTVAGMVVTVLVLLYPRQQLIDRLRQEPRNDSLSVSYLANLLESEPDNEELRVLLAERYVALRQIEQAQTVLVPLQRQPSRNPSVQQRQSQLSFDLLDARTAAAPSGSEQAQQLRAALIAALRERAEQDWPTPQLLAYARKATALEELALAQRFYAHIRFDDAQADQQPWFAEAVRTAMWARDYAGAAELHRKALLVVDGEERRRAHLREALVILQSGNLLDQALTMAQRHDDCVGQDRVMLEYLTRLALAANRPDVADGYAKRMLRMNAALRQAAPVWLGWLQPWLEGVVPAAQAAGSSAAPAAASVPVAASAPAPVSVPVPATGAADPWAHLQPGDPRAPYDEARYTLAYETFLANRDLDAARRVAVAAVRHLPQDLRWRERWAQVCEWSGRPAEALEQWREIARLALQQPPAQSRDTVEKAFQGVQRLAPGLQRDDALVSLWQGVQQVRPLTAEEVLTLVALHERLGRPQEALRLLQQAAGAASRPAQEVPVALLQAQVDLAERLGQLPLAIETQRRVMARQGATPERAMRLASWLVLQRQPDQAYAALTALTPRPPASDVAYWRLLGQMAWSQQDEQRALQALQTLADQNRHEPLEAERLLMLLRTRDTAQAARESERAWRRWHEPTYLISALDLWWERHDAQSLREVDRLLADVDPKTEAQLAREPYFWVLRSQWHQARQDPMAALVDMRRALAAEPNQVDVHLAYLFLLIDANVPRELERALTRWLPQARRDRAYDPAYAAGYMALERPREAWPFWQRQAEQMHQDPLWMGAYAEVLAAVGQADSAQLVRAQALRLTRRSLREAQAGVRTSEGTPLSAATRQDLQRQLARLTLQLEVGDPAERAWRQLWRDAVAPMGAMSAAARAQTQTQAQLQESVVGWWFDHDQQDLARRWQQQQQQRSLRPPATALGQRSPTWLDWGMALHDGDAAAVGQLMTHRDEPVSLQTQAEAEHAVGHLQQAQALRLSLLQGGQHDNDSLHQAYAEQAWQATRRWTYQWSQQQEGLRAQRQQLSLWVPKPIEPPHPHGRDDDLTADRAVAGLGVLSGWGLRWDQAQQRAEGLSDGVNPVLGQIAAHDRAATLQLQLQPDRSVQVDTELGVRAAEEDFATLSVAVQAQVAARWQLRAELGWHQPSSDSLALSVSGYQNQLRLGSEAVVARDTPLRVGLRVAQLALQSGESLGQVLSTDWELSHALRQGHPGLVVRVFGQYAHYRLSDRVAGADGSAGLPAWTSRLTPGGEAPSAAFWVPQSFALHGVGLSAGWLQRDGYSRTWRPFVEWNLTQHSRFGFGHDLMAGVGGPLWGGDQWQLRWHSVRAGAGGDGRQLDLRYVRPF